MRENGVRNIWAAGGNVVNAWLAIANSFSAEVMANEPFDSVTVDIQHRRWQSRKQLEVSDPPQARSFRPERFSVANLAKVTLMVRTSQESGRVLIVVPSPMRLAH